MSTSDQSKMKEDCPNKRECWELLQLILDGEASQESRDQFLKYHLEQCLPCYNNYNLEIAIRQLLKAKCTGQAPAEVVQIIRTKVSQNLPG